MLKILLERQFVCFAVLYDWLKVYALDFLTFLNQELIFEYTFFLKKNNYSLGSNFEMQNCSVVWVDFFFF